MARTKRGRGDDPPLWKAVGLVVVLAAVFPVAFTVLPAWGCFWLVRKAVTTRDRDDVGVALVLVPVLVLVAGLNASFWSSIWAIHDPGAHRGSFREIPGMWGHVPEGCTVRSELAFAIAQGAFWVAVAALALTVAGFVAAHLLVRRHPLRSG